jgi:hypothetical protein
VVTWTGPDRFGGWVCQVEQGHYGHLSRKATWLYARFDLGAIGAKDPPSCP